MSSNAWNVGDLLILETVLPNQFFGDGGLAPCECSEQENQQDHLSQDVSHQESVAENVGDGESA